LRELTTVKGNVTMKYTKVFTTALREAVAIQDLIRRRIERPEIRAVRSHAG